MPGRKVIPLTDPKAVRTRILKAVGSVVARIGPGRVSTANVASEAGVDPSLIKRYFGGLASLLDAFADTNDFWPSIEELAGGDIEELRSRPLGEQLSAFFRNYLQGVRRRPWTLACMAAESRDERTLLTHALRYVRERRALEFFEAVIDDPDEYEHLDLTAVILVMAMSVSFIGIRSRSDFSLGGIDLDSDAGWERIERIIDRLLVRGLAE